MFFLFSDPCSSREGSAGGSRRSPGRGALASELQQRGGGGIAGPRRDPLPGAGRAVQRGPPHAGLGAPRLCRDEGKETTGAGGAAPGGEPCGGGTRGGSGDPQRGGGPAAALGGPERGRTRGRRPARASRPCSSGPAEALGVPPPPRPSRRGGQARRSPARPAGARLGRLQPRQAAPSGLQPGPRSGRRRREEPGSAARPRSRGLPAEERGRRAGSALPLPARRASAGPGAALRRGGCQPGSQAAGRAACSGLVKQASRRSLKM